MFLAFLFHFLVLDRFYISWYLAERISLTFFLSSLAIFLVLSALLWAILASVSSANLALRLACFFLSSVRWSQVFLAKLTQLALALTLFPFFHRHPLLFLPYKLAAPSLTELSHSTATSALSLSGSFNYSPTSPWYIISFMI